MKLYVGNLPLSFSEDDLASLFENYEVKKIQLIRDRETQKSRGFAFVELASKKDGLQAIKELNEKEIESRKIIVNEARPKKEGRKFSSYSRYR